MEWPEWWEWELAFTGHVEARMEERGITEVDLRSMLESATGYRASGAPGRWLIETGHEDSEWAVVVEPDEDDRSLVVVTAYPVSLP
ncbi:MAG: DUF4258 domain-containing protein [Gemmatimonadota bacterium]